MCACSSARAIWATSRNTSSGGVSPYMARRFSSVCPRRDWSSDRAHSGGALPGKHSGLKIL
jgi:hypothetical protein